VRRLLLDTHAFLWWLAEDTKLSKEASEAITDTTSHVHVSAVTVWEIAIKANLGKIDLAGADMEYEIAANGFVELPITARHALRAGSLPRHHDDPFDRMLIAQAQLEDLIIITHDKAFLLYGISSLST